VTTTSQPDHSMNQAQHTRCLQACSPFYDSAEYVATDVCLECRFMRGYAKCSKCGTHHHWRAKCVFEPSEGVKPDEGNCDDPVQEEGVAGKDLPSETGVVNGENIPDKGISVYATGNGSVLCQGNLLNLVTESRRRIW
jgi:hypothetical protein